MTKQIFNAVEAIKLAYVSHTPIVWLVTDYKEVASQVAEQFVCEHLGSFREPAPGLIKGPVQLKEFSIKDRLNYTPDVYYKWVSPDDTSYQRGSSLLMDDIEKFVSMYEQMMTHTAVQHMGESDLLAVRQSIVIIASPTLPKASWLNSYIEVIYVNPLTDAEITALDAIPAVLVDRDWFMIFDNLYNFTEQYNGQGLYWNYWYHVWKTFSVSPFAQSAVFVPGAPSITSVDVSPATATVLAGQSVLLSATVVTANFASKAVNWTLTGALPFPSIVVDGAATAGATSVGFDGATVAANALVGRQVKFGSATTEYTITANTDAALTITPALAANVADDATITAVDSIAPADMPATISALGEVSISPSAVSGTVITATATSVFDNTKSDSAVLTVG